MVVGKNERADGRFGCAPCLLNFFEHGPKRFGRGLSRRMRVKFTFSAGDYEIIERRGAAISALITAAPAINTDM